MKKYKILIADDIPAIRMILSEMLEDVCSECIEAENGEEVIKAVEKNDDIDIIFTDIEMPEVNGFELTEHIRHLDNVKSEIPIIAVTSYKSPSFSQRCQEIGFTHVLAKPYTEIEVKTIIERFCE